MTKDKIFNWRFCLCCGLFLWFIINLFQGLFTEIQEDEAYYALYGEHLAWGYFDHPPMVGLMTFLSSHLFKGILGVRFLTIVFSTLSLWVIWFIAIDRPFGKLRDLNPSEKAKVAEPVEAPTLKHVLLFFIFAFSIVMFNIYGFVTTPDSALILFSALFLLVYQNYLKNHSWKNTLLMGLMMALMIYSKYHAFLLLGLVVLSNLRLLKDGKFYVACLLTLALLTPHILWQINHDFPSFRYHLSGRSEPFRWSYFLEYLPNQLLIFNPFTFGAVVYVLVKGDKSSLPCIDSNRTSPARNDMYGNRGFERGLRFILVGFFFFFWLMAFRGHVEPHWTIVCMIPAVVLVYRKALVDEKLQKYIRCFMMPSLLLVLAVRILLMTPLADRYGYHGKEAYYKAIETVAGDRPVVFRGSFQRPALYHYFTGKPSSTLRCYYDRMTQYDLLQFDREWIGQQVLVCGSDGNISETFKVEKVEFSGYMAEHFQTANRLVTEFKITNADEPKTPVFHVGDTIEMDFSIHNPYDQPIDFHHEEFDMGLKVLFLANDSFSYAIHQKINLIVPCQTHEGHLSAIIGKDVKLGKNRIALGVSDRIATFVTAGNEREIMIVQP
ncbi:MAG: glycosyltransferase family 39 protein [Bacteroidales bacterium]|nr:glycosyltransferase family 39 protein [Bacteroidales bacterium]